MFGGMDMKGGGSEKKEGQGAAPAGSGFGFMNGSAAPAATPTPITDASGFSFMGGSPAASAPLPGSSGFGFMQSQQPPAEEAAPAASGFGFMGGAAAAPAEAPAASGFGFMGASPGKPGDAPVDAAPAGAGVTFGGSAAQKKNIKRRARAPRVGAGVAQYSAPPARAIPEPIQPSSSYGSAAAASAPEPAMSTKDQAEEARRRAEDFLQSQMQNQSKLGSVQVEDTISSAGLKAPTSQYTPEVDDELEEAKRAAEEAQARLAREGSAAAAANTPGQPKSAFSWFGGLRKSDSSNGVDAKAARSGSAVMSSRNSESSMTGIPSPGQSQHKGETPAEKMLREQEEIKKSMAERHFKMASQEEDAVTGTVWDRPTPTEEPAPSWTRPAAEYSASGWKPSTDNVPGASAVPSWGVKAAAPPPPSPRQLMDILLQQFSSDVKRAMSKVAALRQQRNMLLEERFVAFAKERLAVQQIVQTEKQQQDAAENEDFDLAERLQVVLDGHNREKAECSAILDNISKALAQLDEQTPGVIDGVAVCFKNVEEDLKDFQGKQQELDSPVDAIDRFATTAKQLSGEDERLKSESKHLEREEDLVKLERSELDTAIAEQTAELDTVRDSAKKKLDEVEREMDELRERLRLKAAEAQQLKMQMESQDADISRVLVKFNRQITRVQKKEMSVKENRNEWTNEHTAYQKLKDAHEAEVKAHSEALLHQNDLLDSLKSEINMAFTFQDIIAQEVTFGNTREENEEADGDLAQLQADVVKCEAAVSEAAMRLKAAEASLVSLDGESRRLLEKLPKLEAEKKNAAAKRDFKTAGRASKEIKEASSRLADLEESLITEVKAKRKECQSELERVQKELDQEKAMADEKEKESGTVSMLKISERIKTLLETKMKVCGNSSPDTVKGVGGLVLKGQIDALKNEGRSLGEKFGGWDEIVAEIENAEAEGEAVAAATPEDTQVKEVKKEKPVSTRPSDEVIPENVEKGKALALKLTETEEGVATAAEQELYELAAELDEVLEGIKSEIEELDLTAAESELIASGDSPAEEPAADDTAENAADENSGGPEEVEEEEEQPAESIKEATEEAEDQPVEGAGEQSAEEETEKEAEDDEEPSIESADEKGNGETSDGEEKLEANTNGASNNELTEEEETKKDKKAEEGTSEDS